MMRPPSRRNGTAARTAAVTPPTFTANRCSSAERSAEKSLTAPPANTPAFKKALDRYETRRDEIFEEAFAAPTAREAIQRLLEDTAERLRGRDGPSGCLMVQAALCGGEECDGVRKDLAGRRAQGEVLIRKRLERGKMEGDLPKDVDLVGLARYLATVMQGMAVQAASGASSQGAPRHRPHGVKGLAGIIIGSPVILSELLSSGRGLPIRDWHFSDLSPAPTNVRFGNKVDVTRPLDNVR